jgi:hypothetical protein
MKKNHLTNCGGCPAAQRARIKVLLRATRAAHARAEKEKLMLRILLEFVDQNFQWLSDFLECGEFSWSAGEKPSADAVYTWLAERVWRKP